MISADAIRTIAANKSIHPGVIEKDYVISKVLMALAQIERQDGWLVFKGGTALKKCYYHDWRYSEDIDFTAKIKATPAQIREMFQGTVENTADAFGLPIRVSEYSQYPKDSDDIVSAQLKLTYDGPLRQSSGQKNNIRVDITTDETIIFEPVTKKIAREYGDDIEAKLTVYSLEEIVAEKLRSILQRGKSRDYHDVWALLKNHGNDFDHNRTLSILLQKCRSRDIPQPTIEDFFRTDQLVEAERFWERGLAHQLRTLPTFSAVQGDLEKLIREVIRK